ncbi:MAG: S-layer homology domain-containing protein [Actinomycetota bacterium]|nr:S-layer homology domain-containing protein [Actinomycetota bacterium]
MRSKAIRVALPRPHRTARRSALLVIALILVAVAVVPAPSHATQTIAIEDDIIEPVMYEPLTRADTFDLLASATVDSLSLILYPDELRRYSTGHDIFEVWECPASGPVPVSAASFAAAAESEMTAYFSWLSDGRYDPDFVVGGTIPVGQDCSTWARNNATGVAAGALFLTNESGGYAGPGYMCPGYSDACPTTYPDNHREGFVGVAPLVWSTVAHEMGHMLSWPHSFTGDSTSEYDNAIDLMSGNYGTWTSGGTTWWGTNPDPYATVAISRYGSGWFDPDDVAVWDGNDAVVTLHGVSGGGIQAFVIDQGSSYFVLGVRTSSGDDPIPTPWSGVEVYEVTRCPECWGLNAEITPTPGVPFNYTDREAYAEPLSHVLGVGGAIALGDADVTVVAAAGDTFTLGISVDVAPGIEPPPELPPDPLPEPPATPVTFTDVPLDHAFFADIEWLASEGITKGCNPPTNDQYCPDANVTRAQMAAFLVRAFDYTDNGGGNLFTDDNTSIFETDIDRLGTAGVTKGCNPPTNDQYCPDANVTRAQMAAFLHRALG